MTTSWRRSALLALLLVPAAACEREHPCMSLARRTEDLPVLKPVPKQDPVELRVLYLEDPRVPHLTAAGRAALYARVELRAKEWLGYTLRLREVGERDLRVEFSRPDIAFRRPQEAACIAASVIDADTGEGEVVVAALASREFDARGAEVFARLFPETRGMSPAAAQAAAGRPLVGESPGRGDVLLHALGQLHQELR